MNFARALGVAGGLILSMAYERGAFAADDPSAADEGPHRIHIVLGATGAPYFLFNLKEQGRPYIGITLMPELRFAVSLVKTDSWRLFASGRYTGFSLGTNFNNDAPATPASEVPLMAAIGISGRISRGKENKETITSSLAWVSFQLGYANFKVRDTTFITGPTIMISLDTDALSFNLGD
jgi:hypothetical protein